MLHPIAPDLWELRDDLRMPGGLVLPVRMTVARLSDGGLLLHAPLQLDDAAAAEIAALGPVRAIVAPNLLHHLFAEPASRRFPDAAVWAPEGLRKKQPGLRIDGVLDAGLDGGPAAFAPGLDAVFVGGAPAFAETVFFHRVSGSLICTDLLFNIQSAPNFITPWILRLTGTWRRFALSRAWRFAVKDRGAAAAAADRVVGWAPRRVIPGHGEVLDGDAVAETVAHTLGWMRGGRRQLPG